jgi:hypothetical protein
MMGYRHHEQQGAAVAAPVDGNIILHSWQMEKLTY